MMLINVIQYCRRRSRTES